MVQFHLNAFASLNIYVSSSSIFHPILDRLVPWILRLNVQFEKCNRHEYKLQSEAEAHY